MVVRKSNLVSKSAMSNTEILTATEASRAFSDMLHRVAYNGESFVIKKGSRLMARITPVAAEAEPEQETAVETHHASSEDEAMQLEGMSPEDAEYFKTVLEQIRKVPENA
jgi:antitoxin (DNA-binding transcriptional repressor) of toxin-antitoxin stability system